jgi:hypothetical protein
MGARASIALVALTLVIPLDHGREPARAHAQALSDVQARPPDAGAHCLAVAQGFLYLIDQTAYALCLGAGSDAPIQCFADARAHTMLTDPQIVGLCRCAISAGPVGCYARARAQAFLTDDQLVTMCSAVVTQQLGAGDCAARGY